MSGAEPSEELKELGATLASIESVLKPDDMRAELATLEGEAADPDLWGDQDRAQRVTRRMATLRADLARLDGLHGRLDDLSAPDVTRPDRPRQPHRVQLAQRVVAEGMNSAHETRASAGTSSSRPSGPLLRLR